ncbi:MAG: shikimate dehydrogenase [Pirellulaceae bacterium]|nr:shikimate dehydrogenase [Pirellulaceae bacterium]
MTARHVVINGKTKLYGLFADPVDHLQTPAAFNDLLAEMRLDSTFVPFHVSTEQLSVAIAGLKAIRNCPGFCVSLPHKKTVAELCDELMPNALACGVVNGVRFNAKRQLIGETFDGLGMLRAISLHRNLDTNSRVLLAGAGGVGRAIAVALALKGVGHLTIVNRTSDKARHLAETIQKAQPSCDVHTATACDVHRYDIIINATSVGMHEKDPLPIDLTGAQPGTLVAEVIMKPEQTQLLEVARSLSLDIVPGREMLTQQLKTMASYLGMCPESDII